MDASHILPQIKTKEFTIGNNTNLVHKDFISDLIVCYVEDSGSTMTFITQDRLKELMLDWEKLHKLALKNLLELPNTKNGLHTMDNGDGTKAISFETYDSYDAARFLLLFDVLLDKFVEIVGDPFLVAIPTRDFLLAVPQKHEKKLAEYATQLFESKENPITKELFLFSKKEKTFKS